MLWALGEMTIYGDLWSDLPTKAEKEGLGGEPGRREAGPRLLTQRPAAEEPR